MVRGLVVALAWSLAQALARGVFVIVLALTLNLFNNNNDDNDNDDDDDDDDDGDNDDTMMTPLSPFCRHHRAYKNDGRCPPVSNNPEEMGGGDSDGMGAAEGIGVVVKSIFLCACVEEK